MNFIPRPPHEPVRVCQRCELQTPKKYSECVHCSDLSDRQLQLFLEEHQAQKQANSKIGFYFAMAAVIIFVLMVLSAIDA